MQKDSGQDACHAVLVTGGTRGVGLAIARRVARSGPRLIIVGRDEIAGDQAIRAILNEGAKPTSVFIRADLSLLTECERVVRELEQSTPRLDALVHSAGSISWTRRETAEGFEVMFATHFLARYYLSRRLLPLLHDGTRGRIVLVEAVPPSRLEMDFDDLQSVSRFSMFASFRKAVLAEHLFAQELAEREGPSGVAVNITNPGTTNTDIQRGAPWYVRAALQPLRPMMHSPEQAARNAEKLILRSEMPTGRLWPDAKRGDVSVPIARDKQAAHRMWLVAERLIDSSLGVGWLGTASEDR